MFHFFITKCICFWPLSRMANFSIVFLFLTVFKVASLCAHSPNLNDVLFNGNYEFIDMSYPFDDSTIYWPNTKHFELTERNHSFQNAGFWYAANNYAAAEHGGTHFDAPYHFQVNGKQVGEIPLDKLILPLIIIDISSKVNDDPNFVLYKHHLDFMVNDNFGKPCIIIFKFGWSKFINDRVKYLGLDKNNNLNFPGLSEEVAEWITSSYKNVIGVGVDTSSIDVGSTTNFPAHKILSKAGLYNLENVKLDRHVPEHGCTALVMPMKIAKGTGAPLRLVAICPNNQANF